MERVFLEINAVLVAVIVMIILCLMRLNVVLSIFIGALTGGLLSGMSVDKVISTFGKTIVDGSEVALSYALLGGFAALISYSGITDYIVGKIITSMKKENSQKSRLKIKILLVAVLLVISVLSQNIIPVHIAFIPILIPPLLSLFNELQMDRRLIATVIGFGLCFPYILFPYGYGHIFQSIIFDAFGKANVDIEFNSIWKAMLIPSMGYVFGLIVAIIMYWKPRTYKTIKVEEDEETKTLKPYPLIVTGLAILGTFVVQTLTESMIFGALAVILIFFFS